MRTVDSLMGARPSLSRVYLDELITQYEEVGGA